MKEREYGHPPPPLRPCSDTLTPRMGGAAWEKALSVASRFLIPGSPLLPYNPPAGAATASSSGQSLNILVNSLPMSTRGVRGPRTRVMQRGSQARGPGPPLARVLSLLSP